MIVETGSSRKVIVKGSPEMISELCSSNVPPNFEETVSSLTQQGLRVIAFASKVLSEEPSLVDLQRDECETNLELLGLLSMENHLKSATTKVILDL